MPVAQGNAHANGNANADFATAEFAVYIPGATTLHATDLIMVPD